MPDEKEKKPYYKTISAGFQTLEKTLDELDKKANMYEMAHTVLHRSFSMSTRGNFFYAAICFCCATEPGETPNY